MSCSILIVDDEESILTSLELAFKKQFQVFCADSGQQAIEMFKTNPVDFVFLDLGLKDIQGLDVMKEMKRINPLAVIIILTAANDVETAVTAMKMGAADYVTKPYEIGRLKHLADKTAEQIRLRREVDLFREEKKALATQDLLIGKSAAIQHIREMVTKMASNRSTVLLTGESGSGKEVVARSIHYSGKYRDKPFVPIHMGALSEGIIESELFGHEKGAFTGAHSTKSGKFEYANGGTLFLDEISTMPQHLQIKLLRVLQEKVFTRVGGTQPLKVDIRIIAATNTDLKKEVSMGRFREDLYYRLNVVNIYLPPLRERKEDIQSLVLFFLKKYSIEFNKSILEVSEDALQVLKGYHWPGNIRELQNIIERTVVLSENQILSPEDLPVDLFIPMFQEGEMTSDKEDARKNLMEKVEREYLIKILKECKWNRVKAAQRLGIHRNTLQYKMKKMSIEKEGHACFDA
ncbi:MAG: sigma-54-dependent Fis family transcriptional regulator [Candidatus Aureabacteria bacterium]|nr:sigma-54-dependent Fis family transcriptional regulator [Candidatus Auribacterota bacterium]